MEKQISLVKYAALSFSQSIRYMVHQSTKFFSISVDLHYAKLH